MPGASTRDADREHDARLVAQALAGDQAAFGQLYDRWFDRAFRLAERIVRDDETAGEVCQDAFVAAWRGLPTLQDPASFGGWLLRIARNGALTRAGREARSRPTDPEGLALIERVGASPASAPAGFDVESRLGRAEDPETAAADGEIVALVHEAVAALGERDAEVLDLQLRYHLTPAEVGEVIGLNRNAANQLCHRVRARFATAFGARLLWSGSRPACPDLAAALTAAGVEAFDARAVAVADDHADRCDRCAERRRVRLEPGALFGAIGLVPVLAAIRAQVAHGLTAAGVPMQGSSAIVAGAGAGAPGSPASGSGGPAGPGGSERPGGPGGPGEPADGRVARSLGNRRQLALAGLAAAVVLLVLFALLGQRSVEQGEVAARTGASTTVAASAKPAPGATTAPTSSAPAGPAPTGGEPTTAPPPTSAPTATAPPATSTPTSTTLPPTPPSIDQLTLDPSIPQDSTYEVGPKSPLLTWQVSGATEVKVWLWFDDGETGPRQVRVESTDAAGSVRVCPGTLTTPTTCSAPPGRYTYVIEATSASGMTVTSDQTGPPGFDVRPAVIN